MHPLAAAFFHDNHPTMLFASIGLLGLLQLGSWLATRKGRAPFPALYIFGPPVVLYVFSLNLLLLPAYRPNHYDDGAQRSAAEDTKVLRRDLDEVTAKLYETNAVLKALLHAGVLIGIIALCRGAPFAAQGKESKKVPDAVG